MKIVKRFIALVNLLTMPCITFAQINYGANNNFFNSIVSSSVGNFNTIGAVGQSQVLASFAGGYTNTVLPGAIATFTYGDNNEVGGNSSFGIGQFVSATANNCGAIGYFLRSTATGSIAIGNGISVADKLNNNIENSLMVGFNSEKPTLFVGPTDPVVYPNGFVGIGTTSNASTIGYLLAVKGAIIAEKVKVAEYVNWPDYVFSINHDLMPLDQVENYVIDFCHLPNVPSALEIQQSGYDIADMDAILLEKIEELYLHIIEMNKEIEHLQKQLSKKQ